MRRSLDAATGVHLLKLVQQLAPRALLLVLERELALHVLDEAARWQRDDGLRCPASVLVPDKILPARPGSARKSSPPRAAAVGLALPTTPLFNSKEFLNQARPPCARFRATHNIQQ